MRIPEDIIYRFVGKPRQQTPDERGADPVDSLTPGKDALSQPKARQPYTQEEDGQAKDGSNNPEQAPAFQGERRQQDRRQKQVKVLLDTRMNAPRRRTAEHPSIDVKI